VIYTLLLALNACSNDDSIVFLAHQVVKLLSFQYIDHKKIIFLVCVVVHSVQIR
jgi:hypothetical protein